jgi:hypothetical protein
MVSERIIKELIADDEKWIRLLSIPHRGDSTHRSGEIVPFIPTPFQSWYLKWRNHPDSKHRRVILKSRQLMCSTIVLAANFKKLITVPGTHALTLTHVDGATELFRLTVRQWCDQLKALGLLPTIENDSSDLLSFKGLNSHMVFQTAAGRFGGRSASFNTIHLSEIAFWQRDPAGILGGILPSAPQDADIDIESTPNGAEGPLHDYYTDAKNGDLDWDHVFYPWFKNPEYIRPVDEELKLTIEEAKLRHQYGLSDEQVAWRRWQMSEMRRTKKTGNEGGIFKQEYPEDDISCFLSGEDLVLNAEALQDFIQLVQPPVINYQGWDIWKAPLPGQPYVVACDPSDGKFDYSAAHIIDAVSLEAVARFHAKTIPAHFASVINDGARAYNNGLVVVETPGPGAVVLDRLAFHFGYTNLYYHTDEMTGHVRDEPGWPQNVKTRSLLIDTLQTLTEARAYRSYDERTIRELASLTWRKVGNMKRARAEAAPGTHDDLVFALGLGLCTAPDALRTYRKSQQYQVDGQRVMVVDGAAPPRRSKVVYRSMNWDGVIPGDMPVGGGERVTRNRDGGEGYKVIGMEY